MTELVIESAADDPVERDLSSLTHVMPVSVLLGVFACLIVLTILTVEATRVDLGDWNLWIAMGIATVKAALVALYFMHLRYDQPFYALVFVAGVVFLGLFISLTFIDTQQYLPDIENWLGRPG